MQQCFWIFAIDHEGNCFGTVGGMGHIEVMENTEENGQVGVAMKASIGNFTASALSSLKKTVMVGRWIYSTC